MDATNSSQPTSPTPARRPFSGARPFNRRPFAAKYTDTKSLGVFAPRNTQSSTPTDPSAPLSASLKKGFAKEEGGKPTFGPSDKQEVKRKRKRGPMGGAFAALPRMQTFKNKPSHKTGTDEEMATPHDERLRVIVLGGNEEVGRNCTLLEYGNDIIIIDLGLQFPDEDMPGVDYIVPNMSYLKGKERNVRGVIITHGHYDHIGGIPHLMPLLGNPPLFATDLTCGIIAKRQEDHRDKPPLRINVIKSDDVLQLGAFKVEFFGVSHSIPCSMGVIVGTPCGTIVHTGDFKLDSEPGSQSLQETDKIKQLGERNVLALLIDSTNASQPGKQLPEFEIQGNLDEIIKNAKGRIIIGTFASMIARVQQIILACERANRKVAVEGFSMRSNVAIAQQLGYMNIKKGTLIETKEVNNYPRENVAVICTGAQGEERAALMRIANHEHPFVAIEPGDTVVFSSSVIPGNERSVQRVKDTLYREGAEVIHYKLMDVHAGGHAKQEDLVEMHNYVKPKYIVPIEGNYSFLCDHAKVAEKNGFPRSNIFVADNGQIMEFDREGNGMLTNRKVTTDYVFVDGLGVGNTNQIVLRDRQQLASDGFVIVLAIIDAHTGKLQALPDIIARGFIYMKDQVELIMQTRNKAANVFKESDPSVGGSHGTYLKDKLRDEVGEFLYLKTEQRPMVIPLIIEV
jgi:ribonuclease J